MKTDYAFRVLFTLVEHYGRNLIPIRELARRNEVPKRFLEHIMLEMKAKGWVCSEMGKQGGYRLAKAPNEITAGEVIRYFDGVLAPIGCVSVYQYERCTQERFAGSAVVSGCSQSCGPLMDGATLYSIFQGVPVRPDGSF
jgi:Rrf2 family protein